MLALPSDPSMRRVIDSAAERQISGVHDFRVSLCPLMRVSDMRVESRMHVTTLRCHPSPIPSLCHGEMRLREGKDLPPKHPSSRWQSSDWSLVL